MSKKENNKNAVSDEEIIAVLMQSKTISETADILGISRRTIYNRMEDREFTAKYQEAKNDILRHSVSFMCEKAGKAIVIIANFMEDENINPAIRFQCAKYIFDNVFDVTEKFKQAENEVKKIRNPYELF